MKRLSGYALIVFVLASLLLGACAAAPGASKVQAIPSEYTGTIESINGDQWVVNGQTITVDPSVIQDGPFAVGDKIKVEVEVGQDGSVTVTRVEQPSSVDLSQLPQLGDDNSNGSNSNDANMNDDNSNSSNSNGTNSNDTNMNDDNSNGSNSNDANMNEDNSNSSNSNDEDSAISNSNDDNGNDDNSAISNSNDNSSGTNDNSSTGGNSNDNSGNDNSSSGGNSNDDNSNSNSND